METHVQLVVKSVLSMALAFPAQSLQQHLCSKLRQVSVILSALKAPSKAALAASSATQSVQLVIAWTSAHHASRMMTWYSWMEDAFPNVPRIHLKNTRLKLSVLEMRRLRSPQIKTRMVIQMIWHQCLKLTGSSKISVPAKPRIA